MSEKNSQEDLIRIFYKEKVKLFKENLKTYAKLNQFLSSSYEKINESFIKDHSTKEGGNDSSDETDDNVDEKHKRLDEVISTFKHVFNRTENYFSKIKGNFSELNVLEENTRKEKKSPSRNKQVFSPVTLTPDREEIERTEKTIEAERSEELEEEENISKSSDSDLAQKEENNTEIVSKIRVIALEKLLSPSKMSSVKASTNIWNLNSDSDEELEVENPRNDKNEEERNSQKNIVHRHDRVKSLKTSNSNKSEEIRSKSPISKRIVIKIKREKFLQNMVERNVSKTLIPSSNELLLGSNRNNSNDNNNGKCAISKSKWTLEYDKNKNSANKGKSNITKENDIKSSSKDRENPLQSSSCTKNEIEGQRQNKLKRKLSTGENSLEGNLTNKTKFSLRKKVTFAESSNIEMDNEEISSNEESEDYREDEWENGEPEESSSGEEFTIKNGPTNKEKSIPKRKVKAEVKGSTSSSLKGNKSIPSSSKVIATTELRHQSRKSHKHVERDYDDSDSDFLMKKKTKRAKKKRVVSKDSDEISVSENEGFIKEDNTFNEENENGDYEEDIPEEKTEKKKKRKRKRIKVENDSDSNGSDKNEKSKRKNIRKLIKSRDLDYDTKRAAEEETLRKKRIQERQRLYNSYYEKPKTTEVSELVLDFDPKTKEKLLYIDKGLLKHLKPHQVTGIKFMWDACFETVRDCKEKPGSGCVLAHCMGLGKTLQVITLMHTLIVNTKKTGIEKVLVLTPLSTVTNWAKECHQWLGFCKMKDIEIYDMSKYRDKDQKVFKIKEWFEDGGICIMGYDMFRILSNPKSTSIKRKHREAVQKCLIEPGPDVIICDEGHLLKNEKTSISQAVTRLHTKRRIVLTGTPLQNNLKEYYCMIQFIKPNLLGTYKEYLNRFVNPITNGQYTDSNGRDIQLMKNRAHILHKLLEGCVQRKDYSVLSPYLPPKHEYVVHITLSELQKRLYEHYMTTQRAKILEESVPGKGAKLFQDFQNLRRIWTHPMALRVNSDSVIKRRMARETSESEGSLKDFVVDDDVESFTSKSESSISDVNDDFDNSDTPILRKTTRRTRANNDGFSEEEEEIPERKEDPSEWWMSLCPETELNNIHHSPKLMLLMEILQECESIGDKMLVFSQSLQSLDVIEHFLSLIDRKNQGEEIEGDVNNFHASWTPGLDYFRLDGSCTVEQRENMCKIFNDVTNLRGRLFLISTKAGGLGINLVSANRVIIFDVSWNPSHDTQSIFRVYRFGQNKPCYIYRFIAMGTMEQRIYERQVTKQATAKRVVDEQQIVRHYNQSDLLELYKYELEPSVPREIPILPKDRLFAELLSKHEKYIFKYHEHDSLLENEENENLTEEERKAAWEEYEAEKTRATQAQQYVSYNRQAYGTGNPGGAGPVTSSKVLGFPSNVLLQLLNMKITRDFPNIGDQQRYQQVPELLKRLYEEINTGKTDLYRELVDLQILLQNPTWLPHRNSTANQQLVSALAGGPNTGGVVNVNPQQQQNNLANINPVAAPTTPAAMPSQQSSEVYDVD